MILNYLQRYHALFFNNFFFFFFGLCELENTLFHICQMKQSKMVIISTFFIKGHTFKKSYRENLL